MKSVNDFEFISRIIFSNIGGRAAIRLPPVSQTGGLGDRRRPRRSAPPGTAVAVVTEAATEVLKAASWRGAQGVTGS